MIRLRGDWLRHAGFEEGRQIHVDVVEGRLTLILAIDAKLGKDALRSR